MNKDNFMICIYRNAVPVIMIGYKNKTLHVNVKFKFKHDGIHIKNRIESPPFYGNSTF